MLYNKGMAIKIIIDIPMRLKAGKSLFISFPYSKELVELMKSFNEYWWHPEQKMWELPFTCLNALKEQLNCRGELYEVFDQTVIITYSNDNLEKCKSCNVVHNFKTTPRPYQVEGFNYGMNSDKWLLADDPGLGKSFQTINIALAKRNQKWFKHCLIVVGVNNLKLNWCREIRIHSNEEPYVLGQRLITRGPNKGNFAFRDTKEKLQDLNEGIDNFFIITNVETLRNEQISDKLGRMCRNGEIGMVIADEIHKCKDPESQQGKGFQKLLSDQRIALSGTPLLNSIEDLYIILKWLDYENHTFLQYKNYFCIFGGWGNKDIIGYKHKDELINKLNACMLRRKKENVTDLPPVNQIPVYIEMTHEEWVIYDAIKKQIKQEIDKIVVSKNPLAQFTRLRQATGFSGLLSTKSNQSSKMDMMIDIIEQAVSNNEKVVVFSEFTQIVDEAFRRCKKYKPAKITGAINIVDRDKEVVKFQNNDECKVLLGNTKAMGTGITLTAANNVIFLDEPWNDANKKQAYDRCHRIGTEKVVNVYTLLCKDTIDDIIRDIVIEKGNISNYFIDGGKTKRQLLQEFIHRVLGD